MEVKIGKTRVAKTKIRREETRTKRTKKERRNKKKEKTKKEKTMEVNKVAEEWEIWDEEEKVAKSEEEAKKLAPQRFYKWIFGKKASKKMPMKKL